MYTRNVPLFWQLKYRWGDQRYVHFVTYPMWPTLCDQIPIGTLSRLGRCRGRYRYILVSYPFKSSRVSFLLQSDHFQFYFKRIIFNLTSNGPFSILLQTNKHNTNRFQFYFKNWQFQFYFKLPLLLPRIVCSVWITGSSKLYLIFWVLEMFYIGYLYHTFGDSDILANTFLYYYVRM